MFKGKLTDFMITSKLSDDKQELSCYKMIYKLLLLS